MKHYSPINLTEGNIMSTKKEKRMKKCPFCGGKASISSTCVSYQVYCTKCGARTKWYKAENRESKIVEDMVKFLCGEGCPSSALAIEAWNKRRSK